MYNNKVTVAQFEAYFTCRQCLKLIVAHQTRFLPNNIHHTLEMPTQIRSALDARDAYLSNIFHEVA